MTRSNTVTLTCKISRGGFSGERVFRVRLPDGADYVGACPLQYCYTRSNQPLSGDQPPAGKTVDGKVEARIIREEEDEKVLISIPNGEVLIVDRSQLALPPREVSPDVPVQS